MLRKTTLACLSLITLSCGLIGSTAMAQTASEKAANDKTEAWDETEVVIKAHLPGPAIWRIQKGGSEVIVIGILPVFPKGLSWNSRRIENALKGAHVLITPPPSKLTLGEMMGLMSAKNLPNHQTLKAVLPPELNARYEAMAWRANTSIKPFIHDRPVWAGARLRKDVLAHLGLSEDEPLQTIVRLAHRQDVEVRAAGRYKLGPVLKDVNTLSEEASEACLNNALDDIEFDLDRAPKAAAAWANGDIRTVHANYQGSALIACLDNSGKGAAMVDKSIDDTVNAIDDALQTPGKSVAVFSIAALLRKGGALDRLAAQGAKISSPDM